MPRARAQPAPRRGQVRRDGGSSARRPMLVCSNVSPDAIDDDALAAAQLHALADARRTRAGCKIAYEALAWGRHVSEYDHAWRIVAAADHPALGTCLDSFHILRRGTDAGHDRRDPRREDLLPAARGRAATCGMDVLQWSRHYRCFPGQGALDVAGFVRARAGHRLRRPALARGLQRRLPPGRPVPHGGRRDALADRARGRAAPAARRALDGFAFVELGVDADSAPETEDAAARDGLRARRPAPHQAGAAVRARRHPRGAQPRRGDDDPEVVAIAVEQPRTRTRPPRAPRRCSRPRGGAPPRRGRGRPDGGRGARRHRRVFFCGAGLARRLPRRPASPAATRVPIDAHRPHHARPAVRGLRRGGALLPLACWTCEPSDERGARRARRARAQPRVRRRGDVRVVLNVPALAGTRDRRPSSSTSRSPAPTRSRGARDARARRPAARRSPRTTTTTSRRGSTIDTAPLRELGVLYDRDAARASSCTSTRPALGGRVFFEVLERRGGYARLRRRQLTRPHGSAATAVPRRETCRTRSLER